eukprot:PhF_6_TR21175/c0_g1_i2/m.30521
MSEQDYDGEEHHHHHEDGDSQEDGYGEEHEGDESPRDDDGESSPRHDEDLTTSQTEETQPLKVTVEQRLRELELFSFSSEADPKDDPTGRLAYKTKCAEFEFFMFPITSVIDKFDTDNLVLDHCGLGDKGAIALAEALKINQRITKLSLVGNNIGPKGGEPLLNAIRDSKTLKDINLAQNKLGYRAAHLGSPTVGSLMKQILLRNDKLSDIVLRENKISDSDMVEIAEGLVENSTLQKID